MLSLIHIYVYKRQDQMSQSINEDASKFYFVHHQGKKILSQLFSLISVSYTHLDVYKRQFL